MESSLKIRFTILVAGCLIAVIGVSGWALFKSRKTPVYETQKIETPAPIKDNRAAEQKTEDKKEQPEIIGHSVQNRPIEAYNFGKGKNKLVLIGGIHGGYEYNSVLLAYEFIDYFEKNPTAIPDNASITIIPCANPDGLFNITGKTGRFKIEDIAPKTGENGRLNANAVDLNRNFACNWKAAGVWQQKPVSGGTTAFSEPESAAIRDFVLKYKPAAVVFWHSQSNAIYGSQCGGNTLVETNTIMKEYSKASGYKTVETFNQYEVTGDASDWLASIGIPAMTVELATHQDTEWERNLAGIKALAKYYSTAN